MLWFSEVKPDLPEGLEVADAFSQEFDESEYETKFSRLIRQAYRRDTKESPDLKARWKASVQTLSEGDYYILVILERALGRKRSGGDTLKLVATAVVVVILALLFIPTWEWISDRYFNSKWSRLGFIAACVAAFWISYATGVVDKALEWFAKRAKPRFRL